MSDLSRFMLIAGLLAGRVTASWAQDTGATMQEHMPVKKSVPSKSLTVSMDGKMQTFSARDLQDMLQRTVTVHNGHTQQDEVYTGVGLDVLLAKLGLTVENGGAARVYHSYVRAEGTDHYYVIYSASELEPTLHTGDSIVALTKDGNVLGEAGEFEIVVAGEKKPARWVRNLSSLRVVTVP